MTTSPADHAPAVPQVLGLVAHPVRWRLLSELVASDRQVRELVALTGQQQSLTSYHLRLLRDGGLVTARRSSADGRDTYYGLDLAAFRAQWAEAGGGLHPALHPRPETPVTESGAATTPVRVLFMCTGNSARSQMAAAILEQLAGQAVRVASAGSHPKALHPEAVRVMSRRGIDIADRRPTHLSTYADSTFDTTISLCDRVREACPQFLGSPADIHWSIPDPSTDPDPAAAMERLADLLTTRIQFLLPRLTEASRRSDRTDHG